MKTYLTKSYIGVKFAILLSICAITLAITSCNKSQTRDGESTSIEEHITNMDTLTESTKN